MNRKQKIIISVTGIFIVLLILVGLTYAYFLTRIQGNTNTKSISVTTADLKLTYGDGNGDIVAEKIQPGTTIDTKTFTVKNEGNATVNNYAVYLEELVNTLSRTSDMVYTLTCTSSVSGKTCNGKTETTFPTQNGLLVTNNIDVNETQSYELKVEYKEMNVDQSEDMNKSIGAKVQIYNLADIVDITGNVTNATTGDYVEMQSNPKTSQISNGKYLIPAVEPGVHTLYVKDSKGTVKGSKTITINKGSTSSVNGDVITVTSDSQTISINITNISSTLTTDIDGVEDYNPFESGTLASAIYMSAKNKTNGTELLSSPKTKINEVAFLPGINLITNDYSNFNWEYDARSYGDTIEEAEAEVNTLSGTDKERCEKVIGKYIYGESGSHGPIKGCNSEGIPLLHVSNGIPESTLSIAEDDYGTSYYYRGDVTNNYVNFANKCWRIVRINGDNSIKLILEDNNSQCNDSTYTGNWSIGSGNWGYTEYEAGTISASDGTINKEKIYVSDYLNGGTNNDKSMATVFKNFQTNSLSNYLDKLKIGDWCLDDKAYSRTGTTPNYIYTELTFQEKLDNIIKGKQIYFNQDNLLKCNGTLMNKFYDNTDMYVGTLTDNEARYSGISTLNTNPQAFLINNYTSTNGRGFRTLSICDYLFDCSLYYVSGATTAGLELNTYNAFYENLFFRPSINLKSGIQITGGDGTKLNPYIVG